MVELSANTTLYERVEPSASTNISPHREMGWVPLSWKDLKAEDEQKKKDNKLYIEVRRKDLFR